MSIQSKNRETLKAVRRENMKPEEYQEFKKIESSRRIYYDRLHYSYANGNIRKCIGWCFEIISNGQHDKIQFNNLSILPNAEMGDPEYQEEYAMKQLEYR